MKEKTRDKVARVRIIYLILCFLINVVGIVALAFINQLLVDQLIGLLIIVVVFSIIITIAIMHNRNNKMFVDYDTSYSRLFIRLSICWGITIAGVFVPEFFVPVMLMPAIISTVCADMISLSYSLFLISCFCYVSNAGNLVILCYIILILISQVISSYMKYSKQSFRVDVLFMVLCSNIVVPVIFYYFTYYEITWKVFVFGIGVGIAVCLFFATVFNYMLKKSKNDYANKYNLILSPNYGLVQDVKNFSQVEYNHAIKVSRLAAECAKEIGADPLVACCGGFYYRIGKMEGEPEIDNAVKLATNHCFPRDVIDILAEYGGILSRPSTPESAIVHMVDCLVCKMEIIEQDKTASAWNEDMIIYQTLNEFSQNGFYDDSGLSMNQFLKIREKLVNADLRY